VASLKIYTASLPLSVASHLYKTHMDTSLVANHLNIALGLIGLPYAPAAGA